MFQERIDGLRKRFILRMQSDRNFIQNALHRNDVAALRECVHKLAGIAGSFGFSDVGEAAAAVQYELDDMSQRPLTNGALSNLLQLLDTYGVER